MTAKAGEKCEETLCPRITDDDSNTASGTTEPISHLIKLRDDVIAAKNQEVKTPTKELEKRYRLLVQNFVD